MQVCFNPRPRRGAGATLYRYLITFRVFVFQSSPAPRRGRYTRQASISATRDMFQSSPAPRRGRYFFRSKIAKQCRCFNPRPRRGAGATLIVAVQLDLGHVSILARAEARALHGTGSLTFRTYVVSILARAEARALRMLQGSTMDAALFQSSPAPRRGRYARCGSTKQLVWKFQSSPAPRRGRYPAMSTHTVGGIGFNPRPRRGAGATRKKYSIASLIVFQSSPAPRRGRYLRGRSAA